MFVQRQGHLVLDNQNVESALLNGRRKLELQISFHPIIGTLKTTVLSSKANCSSLLYPPTVRTASGKNSPLIRLTGVFSPLNPFMFHCTYNTLQSHSLSVIDSLFYDIKWVHVMAGIPSPTEAVRSALKIILGTAIVNRKEHISSALIHDLSD